MKLSICTKVNIALVTKLTLTLITISFMLKYPYIFQYIIYIYYLIINWFLSLVSNMRREFFCESTD